MDIFLWDSENHYCNNHYNIEEIDYYTPNKDILKIIVLELFGNLRYIFGEDEEANLLRSNPLFGDDVEEDEEDEEKNESISSRPCHRD